MSSAEQPHPRPEAYAASPAFPLDPRTSDEHSNSMVGGDNQRAGPKTPGLAADDPLIDVREFAWLLKVSPKTIDRKLARNELPRPILIGRQRRWRRKAIEAWLEDGAPLPRLWRRVKEFSPREQ